jgi:hypothetical protein
MTQRERIRSSVLELAASRQLLLQFICNPRSPGWWLDLSCANAGGTNLSERWRRFVEALPPLCAAIGYRTCDLHADWTVARPYVTVALVPDPEAAERERIRLAVLG